MKSWRMVLRGGEVLDLAVRQGEPDDAGGVFVTVPWRDKTGTANDVERWAPTLDEALAQAALFAYSLYHQLVVEVVAPGLSTRAEMVAAQEGRVAATHGADDALQSVRAEDLNPVLKLSLLEGLRTRCQAVHARFERHHRLSLPAFCTCGYPTGGPIGFEACRLLQALSTGEYNGPEWLRRARELYARLAVAEQP